MGKRKLTDQQVEAMRRKWIAGGNIAAVAREFGISRGYADKILRGTARTPRREFGWELRDMKEGE